MLWINCGTISTKDGRSKYSTEIEFHRSCSEGPKHTRKKQRCTSTFGVLEWDLTLECYEIKTSGRENGNSIGAPSIFEASS